MKKNFCSPEWLWMIAESCDVLTSSGTYSFVESGDGDWVNWLNKTS